MASQAQIQANRVNALKSTGPRTAEGKAKVAGNAVKHGLSAEQVVIAGEDPGQFEFYREAMIDELSPVGAVETTLAERVVGLAWRLRRAERMQAEVFEAMLAKDARGAHLRKMARLALPKAGKDEQADAIEETALGRIVMGDFAKNRVLDRLGLYERRIERSFFKTMGELERLRAMRELEEREGTRGLRTHPTFDQGSKSETRNTKSETNSNDPNSNDKNEGNDREETRGLRTHPTFNQGSKSEIRSTKSETNANDRNCNDRNSEANGGGSVKAEGLGDGGCGPGYNPHQSSFDTARRVHEAVNVEENDSKEQSQSGAVLAERNG